MLRRAAMRRSTILMFALTAIACAPDPFVGCGVQPILRPKADFDGTWAHTVELETIEGPDLGLPTTVESGDATFAITEDWVLAIEGLSVVTAFRVLSHVDAFEQQGRCGSLEIRDRMLPWRERSYMWVDFSTDPVGVTLHALLPDAVVESAFFTTADDFDERDVPRFDEGDDTRPAEWSIPNGYLVYDAACEDETCQTRVRVRHRFVRR